MLKFINIDSLFELYSYQLDFTDSENSRMKFITGPNGYGKTTILSLIDSLYDGQFELFFYTPMTSVEFMFSDMNVKIDRQCIYAADELTDESLVEDIVLNITLTKSDGKKESFTVSQRKENRSIQNLKMYLKSMSCYYIKDRRLSRTVSLMENNIPDTDILTVNDNSDDLTGRLHLARLHINEELKVSNLVINGPVEEKEYNSRKQKTEQGLVKLKKYGLIDESLEINEYDSDNSIFQNAYLNAIERAVERECNFVSKLDTFQQIIDRSDFANKQMEINPKYGYRFKSKDARQTILYPGQLSSGEQHLLIMTYELIFRAPDNSIVLIDEPEISFHLMWQMDFLKNIESIIACRNQKMQCIVATHSPQIFNNRWSLSLDLYSQSGICNNTHNQE